MMEVWKEIEGYNGKYAITDTGIVISVYRMINTHGKLMRVGNPKVLKPSFDKKGYCIVNLYKGDGKPYCKKVHRLVAEAFIGNPKNKRCVCHKDNNPQNNCVDNLYWGTDQENQDQAWADGLHKSEMAIKQIDLQGNVVATYKSQSEAARKTGNNQQNISACVNGKKKTVGGYIWRRLD